MRGKLALLLHVAAWLPAASSVGTLPRSSQAPRQRAAPPALSARGELAVRIGHGYDIHRLAPRDEAGQPLVVGGVRFDGSHAPDFELGCVAHSDGDVIYHSVTDAILGSLCMPDIGQLFPDNDPRLRGADSEVFMDEAYRRMRARGYRVGNVDVTLIAQRPRVNVEHNGQQVKGLMSENLVRLLQTETSRVNVKARTHEAVDAVGECRAIECHVVLTLERDTTEWRRPGP